MAKVITVLVTGALVEFYSATLHLDPAQARARRARLEPVKDGGGVFVINRPPVQFKHGERFGLEDAIPKDQQHALTDVEELAAREAEAKRQRELQEAEAQEKTRQAAEAAAQAERVAQQHTALCAAFESVQSDANGNIDAKQLEAAIAAAKLDFAPTHEQAEKAWAAVVAERAQ